MDRIEVTDDMHARVLHHALRQYADRSKAAGRRKPGIFLQYAAATILLLMVGVAVLDSFILPTNETLSSDEGIVEFESAEKLSEYVGFRIESIGSLAAAADSIYYASYDAALAEIEYLLGEQTYTYRISQGSEDNSGDYNTYTLEERQSIGQITATLKGDGDRIALTLWETDGFMHSLSVLEPIPRDEMIALVAEASGQVIDRG